MNGLLSPTEANKFGSLHHDCPVCFMEGMECTCNNQETPLTASLLVWLGIRSIFYAREPESCGLYWLRLPTFWLWSWAAYVILSCHPSNKAGRPKRALQSCGPFSWFAMLSTVSYDRYCQSTQVVHRRDQAYIPSPLNICMAHSDEIFWKRLQCESRKDQRSRDMLTLIN